MAEDHRTSVLVFLCTLLLLQFLVCLATKFGQEWRIMRTWTVPWSWPIVFIVFAVSEMRVRHLFLMLYQIGRDHGIFRELDLHSLAAEAVAKRQLLKQIVDTLTEIGILYVVINFYKPLPGDLFHWGVMEPFNLDHGWIIWTTFGLIATVAANAAIAGLSVAVNFLSGVGRAEIMTNNSISNFVSSIVPATEYRRVSLMYFVTATSVLAPLIQEIMFRGFLMASLSNWFSTPVAVIISSFSLSASAWEPRLFPFVFISGIVFGLSYAQTRNLVTPIMIHFLWSLGLVLSSVYRGHEFRNQDLLMSDSV